MKIKALSFLIVSFFIPLKVSAQLVESLPPTQVQNLTAEHLGDSISLSWDASTDEDGVVTGYKIYYGNQSVTKEGQIYESEIVVDNKTNYILKEGINADQIYYIAVTAIDDENNESENFSPEAVAQNKNILSEPPSQADDLESPKVIKADYPSAGKIVVTMSEPIKSEDPENSFTIINKETQQYLTTTSITFVEEVATIMVNPEDIDIGATYSVTASYLVTDLAGNPVSSGIVDMVELQTNKTYGGACTDMNCFIEGIENDFESDVPAQFSVNYFDLVQVDYQGVLSYYTPDGSQSPVIQIKIEESNSSLEESIDIGLGPINLCKYDNLGNLKTFLNEVAKGGTDVTKLFQAFGECDVYDEYATFESTTQMGTPGLESIRSLVDLVLEVNDVTQISTDPFNSAPPINVDTSDKVAPLDATKLNVDLSDLQNTKSIILAWTPAKDLDSDIVGQELYVRKTHENYPETGISLEKGLSSYTLKVEGSQSYEVKVVTIDASGNKSFGRTQTFNTGLNESGGGMILVWVILGLVGFGFISARKNA